MLPLLLFALLAIPYVQTYIAQKTATYLSEELGVEIHIGEVGLSVFLDVVLKDVKIFDQRHNILLSADEVDVNIHRISLRKSFVGISNIQLEKPIVNMIRYSGDSLMNYQFLLEYFSKDPEDTLDLKPKWNLAIKGLSLKNAGFSYIINDSLQNPQGFNAGRLIMSGIDLSIRDFSSEDDQISFYLKHLQLQENQGYNLKRMSAVMAITPNYIKAKDLSLELNDSYLSMDAALNYDSYADFHDILHKVRISAEIRESKLEYGLISKFSGITTSSEDFLMLSGKINGRIDNLKIRDLILDAGDALFYKGNIALVGLPDIKETFMHFSVQKLTANIPAIESMNLCKADGQKLFKIPEMVSRFVGVEGMGSFTGFYNDFVANAKLHTPLGDIKTDISLRSVPGSKKLVYKGDVEVADLQLGVLTNRPAELGLLSMTADVNGVGFDKSAELLIVSRIGYIDLMNYRYHNVNVDGNYAAQNFKGSFHVMDPNVDLAFAGLMNLSEENPAFDFNAIIKDAYLSEINLLKRDSLPVLSTQMHLQLSGTDPDKLIGKLEMFNTTYQEGSKMCFVDTLTAEVGWLASGKRMVSMSSGLADAELSGNFRFKDIKNLANYLGNTYFPSRVPYKEGLATGEGNVEFSIVTHKLDNLLGVFLPSLKIAPGTRIEGDVLLKTGYMHVKGSSEHFSYGQTDFEEWSLNVARKDTVLKFETKVKNVYLSDSTHLDNFSLMADLEPDNVSFLSSWNNDNPVIKNAGEIAGYVKTDAQKTRIGITNGRMFINDSLWLFNNENYIDLDSTGFLVSNFMLSSSGKFIQIDGNARKNNASSLRINFRNFDLSEFDPLTNYRKFDLDGILTGYLVLNDIFTTPHFLSDISIRNFGFNHAELGDAQLKSVWIHEKKAASIELDIVYVGNEGVRKPLSAKGMIYPQSKEKNFDLKIDLTNFKVKTLERYLASFTSRFQGLASGKLALQGTFAKPELSGSVKLMRTFLKIDYLNTMYSLADEVFFTPNSIYFNNIVVYDNNDNNLPNAGALVSGKVNHTNFKNWNFDINIQPNNFTMLNTNASLSDLYYGKALVTGDVHIFGNELNVQINVKAKTEKGTVLHIPLFSAEEVSSRKFITFVQYDQVGDKKEEPINPQGSFTGISLFFELEATPDAEIQIILDEKIGDIIKARGNGNMTMTIDSKGEFDMYGDYFLTEGDYLFTLQNVINKRFRIDEGGVMRWTGSPYNADINLNAVYKTKAPLYDLISRYTESEVYKKRQAVECHIGLKGKLMNPDISFDIQVPGADEITKEYIKSALFLSNNEVNQLEMNNQFLGLLVLNRFFAPGIGIGSALASQSPTETTTTTSFEMLSNQVNNWMSQISKEFDIGINYRAGDALTNQELEVALSTQLLNDKLSIDGNIGVGGNSVNPQPTGGQQNTSNIVGDVNIEYKVTPKFKIKVFNRSNQYDYLRQNAPYTQGIGTFYRREFDRWSDLFVCGKKKKMRSQPLK